MSGLRKHFPEFGQAGDQVSQNDIDQYVVRTVNNPSVDASWFGTASGTTNGAITLLNAPADHPRNAKYSVNGITNGTYGGTFTANFIDQFGSPATESVTIGTAVNGGTVHGTAIVARFISGSFGTTASAGTWIGTARIGVGTTSNGSASSNWFGLLTKIAGTGDVKNIVWVNNGTPTTLNAGTALGTLVNTTTHAFQGTSGVTLTDSYRVIVKPTFDASASGTMCAL